MSRVASTRQYFVPPYIFKQAIANGDHRFRNRAIRSLTIRARLEGRRETLSQVDLSSPLGEKFRTVFDAKEGVRLPGTLARFEGHAPSNDENVNSVYENLGIFYDFFAEVFGRSSIDDRGLWLIATLHFDTDFNNAFWDGQQVVYGDGDGLLFQGVSRSLDVLAHELSHGVIQYASGLGLRDEAGRWPSLGPTSLPRWSNNTTRSRMPAKRVGLSVRRSLGPALKAKPFDHSRNPARRSTIRFWAMTRRSVISVVSSERTRVAEACTSIRESPIGRSTSSPCNWGATRGKTHAGFGTTRCTVSIAEPISLRPPMRLPKLRANSLGRVATNSRPW